MLDSKTIMLEAALDVVSEVGAAKISVGKIAEKSGLSRQTIYNTFGSKKELLREAMHYSSERKRRAARQGLANAHTVDAQLDALFEHLTIAAYRFARSKADVDDIVVGAHAIGSEVLMANFEAERKLYEQVFSPFTEELRKHGMTARQFSEVVEKSARAAKREARSLKHLKEMLGTLKTMVLTLLNVKPR